MDQKQSLFQAVVGDPDDLSARLVYADLLEESGEPERAEFIRLQCETEGLDLRHPRREALQDRADDLWFEKRHHWQAELPQVEGVKWGSGFRRGFAEELLVDDIPAFRQSARELFASAPVRRLTIPYPLAKEVPPLAKLPELRKARSLALKVRNRRNAEPLVAFLSSPGLAGLEEFSLRYHPLPESLARVLAGRSWPRLRKLDLGSSGTSAESLQALASGPLLATVTELDMYSHRYLGTKPEAFAALGVARKLRKLDLPFCGQNDKSIASFARLPLTDLEELDLRHNELTCEGVKSLTQAAWAPALRRLDLSSNHVLGDVWSVLGPPEVFPNLQSLDVGHAHWPALGFVPWLRTDRPARLCELNLGDVSRRGLDFIDALAAAPALAGLERLGLKGNWLGEEGIRRLVGAGWLSGLVHLDLEQNRIDDAALKSLAGSDRPVRLRGLKLRDNPITAPGLQALVESSWAPALRVLDLGSVQFGAAGVAVLAGAGTLAGLRELDLSYCRLDDAALESLLRGETLRNLRRLSLVGNPLTGRAADLLAEPGVLPRLQKLAVSAHRFDAAAQHKLSTAYGDRCFLSAG